MPQRLLAALLVVAAWTTPAGALMVTSAKIAAGAIQVKGKRAAPNAQLTWDGQQVGTANGRGSFSFSTTALPSDCVGELSDGAETSAVVIASCGPIGPQGEPGTPGQPGPAGSPGPEWACVARGSGTGAAECLPGETRTGGGCNCGGLGSRFITSSAPSGDRGWSCSGGGVSGGDCIPIASVVCCARPSPEPTP